MKPYLNPRNWRQEAILAALLLVLLALAEWTLPGFLDLGKQSLLSQKIWSVAILVLAMTLIIITGGIDLSVGSTMGLCAVAFGATFEATDSVHLSAIAAILIGALGGALNGLLIARLRVHPLIITLGSYAAYRGIAEGASQGRVVSQFGDGFAQLAYGHWLGIPTPAWIFAVLALTATTILSKAPTGRALYMIGHNETAARYTGIPVDWIRFWLYTMSGTMAGLASLFYISRFDTAQANAGTGFELDVITAVVVGGVSIYGGRGHVTGALLGLALIHETQMFVGRYWRIEELKSILVGALLIGSILIYRTLSAKQTTHCKPQV